MTDSDLSDRLDQTFPHPYADDLRDAIAIVKEVEQTRRRLAVADQDLAGELDRLDKAATRGPWENYTPNPRHSSVQVIISTGLSAAARSDDVAEGLREWDAEFIVWARNHTDEIKAALAAESRLRDLTSRLGFGNGITEPQADNDMIVRYWEEVQRDASEWIEHQSWLNDCAVAGCPDGEDCHEHNPDLISQTALAEHDRLRADLKALIQEKRIAMARDVHPTLAHGALTVGTDEIERILGSRVTINGDEIPLAPLAGDDGGDQR